MSDKKKEPLTIQSYVDAPVTGSYTGASRPDFSRRRRLIKASAAAVPTILTLRSGVAIAATSMHCRDKDAAVTDVPTLTATDEDSWVRRQVHEFNSDSLVAYKADNPNDLKDLLALYEQDGMTEDEIVQAFCSSQLTDVDSQITALDAEATTVNSETTDPDPETTALNSETTIVISETTVQDAETTTVNSETTVLDSPTTVVDINQYISETLTGPFLSVPNADNTHDWFVQTGMEPPSYKGIGQEGHHFIFCGDRGKGVPRYALCYVTFDADGHIEVSNIVCYPDDPEPDAQQITESCACSIDPNFQMGPT